MLLKELSSAIGVSGDESAVREIITNAIRDHVTDLHTDTLGNLTAVKKGTGAVPLRVMLDAHMDEVGFIVVGFDADGLIRFSAVGGIDDKILLGMRVKVGKKQLNGLILSTPIHHSKDQTVKGIRDLRIDIGATSKANAESLVSLGERIAFDSEFIELSAEMVRGKAFDDRVGCALLVDVLQGGPYPVDILASFTVQEEVGLRGAKVTSRRLNPDMAIALEGTTAHDVPQGDINPDLISTPNAGSRIGGGAVISVMDRSVIPAPQLVRFIRQTATQAGLPYQLKTALGGGTNAGSIHLANSGIPSAVISMPCRYIHSPRAILSLKDYENTLALIKAVLNALTAEAIQPL